MSSADRRWVGGGRLPLAAVTSVMCQVATSCWDGDWKLEITIVSIVMSSMSERRTTGLKLPELRIPQGQAKQISHT